MSQMQILAIRDRQLNAYMQPWPAQSLNQAIRMFTDEVNNPQGAIAKHPDDYDLYHVGTFDMDTGETKGINGGPVQIAVGKNVFLTTER